MNLEKVVFAFFILLAATLNFGFVWGDRTHVGSMHLATSLVALLQLSAAAMVWFFAHPTPVESTMASIVSLSVGALLANLVSVIILIAETTSQRR